MVLALYGLGGDVLDLDLAALDEDVVDAVDVAAPAEVLGLRGDCQSGQENGGDERELHAHRLLSRWIMN